MQGTRWRLTIVWVLMVALATIGGGTKRVRADSSWLDVPFSNWNSAGMPIPKASPSDFGGNEAFCAGQERPAETPEDSALVNAGWKLFGTYQSGWGVRVVGGRTGLDGMCRPEDYQYFVFVNGRFAGTVAPAAMVARLDGYASPPSLDAGATGLLVSFRRYASTDPACCPSSTTAVFYHIDRGGGGPLLVPDTANTSPNS